MLPAPVIHMGDFESLGDLAQYLQELDRTAWATGILPLNGDTQASIGEHGPGILQGAMELEVPDSPQCGLLVPVRWLARVLQAGVAHPAVIVCSPWVTNTFIWDPSMGISAARSHGSGIFT